MFSSSLLLLVNISRYSWGTLEKILERVPGKFPGIGSENLFATNFLWFFWRIGNKKFPGIGYKKFLGYRYKKFLGPGSSEWVTRNSWEKLSTFSPDFPVKDSWEFPRIFRKIVTWVHTHILIQKNFWLLIL